MLRTFIFSPKKFVEQQWRILKQWRVVITLKSFLFYLLWYYYYLVLTELEIRDQVLEVKLTCPLHKLFHYENNEVKRVRVITVSLLLSNGSFTVLSLNLLGIMEPLVKQCEPRPWKLSRGYGTIDSLLLFCSLILLPVKWEDSFWWLFWWGIIWWMEEWLLTELSEQKFPSDSNTESRQPPFIGCQFKNQSPWIHHPYIRCFRRWLVVKWSP